MFKHIESRTTSRDFLHTHMASGPRPSEVARVRFRQSSHPALRRIECEEHEGVLTLLGGVPWFYLKQLAQALTVGIEGVSVVVNNIEVAGKPDDERPPSPR